MAIKDNREYRNFQSFEIIKRSEEEGQPEEKTYKVRGYACTFEPYELFRYDGISYREQIDPHAFDECDMSDVIFLVNHEGMVHARNKNGTMQLGVDEHGLWSEEDLGSTTQSREVFEAIDTGLLDQMSFAFVVDENGDEITRTNDSTTRIIHRIRKLYDVSAVSIPANPGTDISVMRARDYFNGEIEARTAERQEREHALALAKAKYRYLEA